MDKTKPEEWGETHKEIRKILMMLTHKLGYDESNRDHYVEYQRTFQKLKNVLRSLKKQWTDEARTQERQKIREWRMNFAYLFPHQVKRSKEWMSGYDYCRKGVEEELNTLTKNYESDKCPRCQSVYGTFDNMVTDDGCEKCSPM